MLTAMEFSGVALWMCDGLDGSRLADAVRWLTGFAVRAIEVAAFGKRQFGRIGRAPWRAMRLASPPHHERLSEMTLIAGFHDCGESLDEFDEEASEWVRRVELTAD